MSKTFDALKPYLDRAMALKAAMALFEWDNETLAPKEAGRLTSKVIGILSGEYFGVVNQDKVKELAKACREDSGLTQAEKAQVRELSEELEKLGCILVRNIRSLPALPLSPPVFGQRRRKRMILMSLPPCWKR